MIEMRRAGAEISAPSEREERGGGNAKCSYANTFKVTLEKHSVVQREHRSYTSFHEKV